MRGQYRREGPQSEDFLTIDDLPALPHGRATVARVTTDAAMRNRVMVQIASDGFLRTFDGDYVRKHDHGHDFDVIGLGDDAD